MKLVEALSALAAADYAHQNAVLEFLYEQNIPYIACLRELTPIENLLFNIGQSQMQRPRACKFITVQVYDNDPSTVISFEGTADGLTVFGPIPVYAASAPDTPLTQIPAATAIGSIFYIKQLMPFYRVTVAGAGCNLTILTQN